MPTRTRGPEVLADTSVAIALVVEDHESHRATLEAVGQRKVGLAGHAVFQTFSVLTRLPPPARRSASVVARLMKANFPENRYLSPEGAAALLARLVEAGLAGGSVYNALVRAVAVYRALGVSLEILAE
jgi:hypothetical protein